MKNSVGNGLVGGVLAFLLGVSISFNTLTFSFFGIELSYVLVLTVTYIIYNFKDLIKISQVKKAYGSIILYPIFFFLFLTIMNVASYNPIKNIAVFNMPLLLNLIVLYSILVHSLRNTQIPTLVILGFSVGSFVLSVLFYFGVGVVIDEFSLRLTLFGLNPNDLGIYMSISIMTIAQGTIVADFFKVGVLRYLFVIPIIVMLPTMVATGSRSAFLMLLVAVLIIIIKLPVKSKAFKFIFSIGLLLVAIRVLSIFMSSDNVIVERLLDTAENGSTAGRTDITTALFPYFLKSPIWGYGEFGYSDIAYSTLGSISSQYVGSINEPGYSPHNTIMEVLMYTGLIGLFFFGGFVLYVYKCAIKTFHRDILPMLLLIPISFALISGQILCIRHCFVIFSFCIVSWFINRKERYENLRNKSFFPHKE